MKIYIDYVAKKFLDLPRVSKRLLAMLVDCLSCCITVLIAFYLRLGEFNFLMGSLVWPLVFSVLFALPTFFFFGLYRTLFRYSGLTALLLKAIAIYGFLFALVFIVIGVEGVPKTIGLIQPLLLMFAVGISRALASLWLGRYYLNSRSGLLVKKVLIYGCGATGRELAAIIAANRDMIVCGFLDDNPSLWGNTISGIRVYEPVNISVLCKSLDINEVLLALTKISRKRRNAILKKIQHARILVRSIPRFKDITTGKVKVSDLHDLDLEDLLMRQIVEPKLNLLSLNVSDKVVMVTGAGGSIGSDICRQIIQLRPKTLLLFEHSEYALYKLYDELLLDLKTMSSMGQDVSSIKLVPLLGSVRDANRIRDVIHNCPPHIIYHTAAYKHVSLVECNPAEGIRNNVFGTLTIATLAAEEGVKYFVLVSTDKAVRPSNIMGATKRLAEMAIQAIGSNFPNTKFTIVRFGNVLASSGSVIPKFRQEIKAGGPIHLTHREITRYFMTISEAAQLVIQAAAIAKGGEVFLLDMGEPVKIIDLARRMVELSGLSVKDDLNPEGDIEIEVTGLRPGEKLHEELVISGTPEPTEHPLIMKVDEEFLLWSEFLEKIKILHTLVDANDSLGIKTFLQELVSGFTPDPENLDWVDLLRLEFQQ